VKTARRPLRHRIALGLSALALVGAVAGAGAAATSAPAVAAPLTASSAPRAVAALPAVAAAPHLAAAAPHLAAATPSPSPSRPAVAATGSNRVGGFAIAVVILIAIGYAARTVRRRSVNRD